MCMFCTQSSAAIDVIVYNFQQPHTAGDADAGAGVHFVFHLRIIFGCVYNSRNIIACSLSLCAYLRK